MRQQLFINDGELEYLLRTLPFGTPINVKFGPRGAWFEFDDEEPLRPDVELLLTKRGVLNENCQGAGI